MIKGSNKYKKLAESVQGIHTIDTLAERLKIANLINIEYRKR